MHTRILTTEQYELLPLLQQFADDYYLVGGTAIALHLGHRRSVDFDLFTRQNIQHERIKSTIAQSGIPMTSLLYEAYDQLHIIINRVKMTFFQYAHPVEHTVSFEHIITTPSLLDLTAMKVYALGRRAKWKDYIDVYFVLQGHLTLTEIASRAYGIFGNAFNEKLLREQLCYFEDINYREAVEYLDVEPTDEEKLSGS